MTAWQRLTTLTIVIAIGPALYAQELKLPPELRQAVDIARAAPPEIGADAMLQVVESGQVSDKPSRRALIEQAFQLAGAAQWKAPMRAVRTLPAETHEFYLAKAYGLKLDALSLQARATKAMLALDKAAARELLSAIPHPRIEPQTCEAALITDPTPLYEILGAIVSSGFTAQEREKEQHVKLLLAYIGQVVSPLEAEPLGAAIAAAGLNPAQSRTVQVEFDSAIESAKAQQTGHCTGDLTLHTDAFWRSSVSKGLVDRAIGLRFQKGAVVSAVERSTPEWQGKLIDLLKDLADWGPGQENSEAGFFHEKLMVYEALLEVTPAGAERAGIREALVHFLASSNLQAQSPAEWFYQATAVLTRLQNSDGGESASLLEAYESSGNPALIVYVSLSRAFGWARTQQIVLKS